MAEYWFNGLKRIRFIEHKTDLNSIVQLIAVTLQKYITFCLVNGAIDYSQGKPSETSTATSVQMQLIVAFASRMWARSSTTFTWTNQMNSFFGWNSNIRKKTEKNSCVSQYQNECFFLHQAHFGCYCCYFLLVFFPSFSSTLLYKIKWRLLQQLLLMNFGYNVITSFTDINEMC